MNEIRTNIKKSIRKLVLLTLANIPISMIVYYVIIMAKVIGRLIFDPNNISLASDLNIEPGGKVLIIVATIQCFIFWIVLRKEVPISKIMSSNIATNFKTMLLCFIVFMGIQFLFSALTEFFETFLNFLGYTYKSGTDAATGGDSLSSISMFLYAVFIAPITEELTYRGFILKSLQKYGTNFAIIISSLFFGLMHANLAQSPFAFMVGIVLGYIAANYSIRYTILFHILNNLLSAGLAALTVADIPEVFESIIDFFVITIPFIAAILILIIKRKKLKTFINNNKSKDHPYSAAFSSIPLWIFIILLILLSLSYIAPIATPEI